jgi:hypothetical protein
VNILHVDSPQAEAGPTVTSPAVIRGTFTRWSGRVEVSRCRGARFWSARDLRKLVDDLMVGDSVGEQSPCGLPDLWWVIMTELFADPYRGGDEGCLGHTPGGRSPRTRPGPAHHAFAGPQPPGHSAEGRSLVEQRLPPSAAMRAMRGCDDGLTADTTSFTEPRRHTPSKYARQYPDRWSTGPHLVHAGGDRLASCAVRRSGILASPQLTAPRPHQQPCGAASPTAWETAPVQPPTRSAPALRLRRSGAVRVAWRVMDSNQRRTTPTVLQSIQAPTRTGG